MPPKCHCGVYLGKLGGVRKNEKCIYIHIWMFLFHDDVIGAQRQKHPNTNTNSALWCTYKRKPHGCALKSHLSRERKEAKRCMRQVAQWPGSWTGISCFGSRTPYPDDSCATGWDRLECGTSYHLVTLVVLHVEKGRKVNDMAVRAHFEYRMYRSNHRLDIN